MEEMVSGKHLEREESMNRPALFCSRAHSVHAGATPAVDTVLTGA
jgi:hypothetical protein